MANVYVYITFFDWFSSRFLSIYIQIGNAVAPPMAAAIGQEIRKAMVQKMQRDGDSNNQHPSVSINIDDGNTSQNVDTTKEN